MTIHITSTTKIVHLNGVPARIWEGMTESGIRVHCFVTRIAVGKDENVEQFEAELSKQRIPSPEVASAYPDRMIL